MKNAWESLKDEISKSDPNIRLRLDYVKGNAAQAWIVIRDDDGEKNFCIGIDPKDGCNGRSKVLEHMRLQAEKVISEWKKRKAGT